MRWCVSTFVADTTETRKPPGEHVVYSTEHSVDWPVGTGLPSHIVSLQSTSGDIGGMVLAGVLLLVLGLTGVAVWRGRASSYAGAVADAVTSDSDSGGVEAGQSTSSPATPTPEQEPEPEPTDQEVIVGILEEHDGRMKQAKIVEVTDWSKSKVSMLLSEMEEEGDISKLRVGRENIISLDGREPDAAGSPFDDE